MRRLVLIPICFLALAVPVVVLASGAEGGFDGVVSSIESRYNVHAQRIPFLGLISFISHKATKGGVSGMHIAEIDDFHADVDGEELNRMVEQKLGSEWERVIRETSRKGNGQTLIYMHPEGSRMGLFVLDLDGQEMDVVQVSVDPNHLNESLSKYDHHHADSSVGDDHGNGESD
ncbi:MAG: hypothetical protein WA354_02155 [Terracidiphilus sp.]